MKENDSVRTSLKQEMGLAHTRFTIVYKKISKGLTQIYNEAIFSNDLKTVQRLHTKFFGFIKKSHNAKQKWGDKE